MEFADKPEQEIIEAAQQGNEAAYLNFVFTEM